jgi:cyclic beta-1,2-glucan synthetase
MTEAERTLLMSVARAVLNGDRGELKNQLDRPYRDSAPEPEEPQPVFPGRLETTSLAAPIEAPPRILDNRFGGFTEDGREYVVVLDGDEETPLPWANVIANPGFGTVVTAGGSAFTWSENSRENRLTPHANDPVSDPTGEAIFLRDDETGEAWSPTPGPLPRSRASGPVVIRHAAGLTRFACSSAREPAASQEAGTSQTLMALANARATTASGAISEASTQTTSPSCQNTSVTAPRR